MALIAWFLLLDQSQLPDIRSEGGVGAAAGRDSFFSLSIGVKVEGDAISAGRDSSELAQSVVCSEQQIPVRSATLTSSAIHGKQEAQVRLVS